MKNRFIVVKLQELGKIVTGHTPPKKIKEYYGTEYAWIKPTDMQIGSRFVKKTGEFYSQKAHDKYKNALLPPMSTCVVTIGTVGEKMCLTKEKCFTNQSVNAIIPDMKRFDPLFVYYLMKFNLSLVSQRNPGTASGRHHVSKSNFSTIEVEVPEEISTQRNISAILGRYDDLIENNTQRIELLESMVKLIYDEWFVKFRFPGYKDIRMVDSELGKIPDKWEIVSLVDIAEVLVGYPFKSKQFCDKSTLKPIVRIRDILKNYTNTFTDEKANEKYQIHDGDILIGMDGIFHMCKWSNSLAYLNQRVARLRPKNNISKYFLFLSVKPNIERLNNEIVGTTVQHLSQEDFKRMKILIPSTELMVSFKEIADAIYDNEIKLRKKNMTLSITRDLLLPKLITGEIDASELVIKVPEVEV